MIQTNIPLRKQTGKLIWIYNGQTKVLIPSAPFPLLQQERMRLKKQAQYQKGELKIKYLFN